MAARVKVIDLAKELGVTSKDLIVALEGMGHKGVRAMTPVPTETANELRVKLGRGRDLPATERTRSVWPSSVARRRPVAVFQSRTFADGLSVAEARVRLSGLNAIRRGFPSPSL